MMFMVYVSNVVDAAGVVVAYSHAAVIVIRMVHVSKVNRFCW